MINDDIHLKIQQYVNGELTGTHLSEFEIALRQNPEWQEEVNFSKAMKETLANKELLGLNQILQKVSGQSNIEPDFLGLEAFEKQLNKPPLPPSSSSWWWGGASLVLMIALGGLFFFISKDSFSPSDLSAQYLVPYENIIHSRGGDNNQLRVGMQAYDEQNYPLAIKSLTVYVQQHPEIQVQFYIGLAYLFNDQSTEAVKALSNYLDATNTTLPNAAKWYLSHAYLKLDNLVEAESILLQLIDNQQYGEQSKQILADLNQKIIL